MSNELNDTLERGLKAHMGYKENTGCGLCLHREFKHQTCTLNPAVSVQVSAANGTCNHHAPRPRQACGDVDL